jgi:hypothetical protein
MVYNENELETMGYGKGLDLNAWLTSKVSVAQRGCWGCSPPGKFRR